MHITTQLISPVASSPAAVDDAQTALDSAFGDILLSLQLGQAAQTPEQALEADESLEDPALSAAHADDPQAQALPLIAAILPPASPATTALAATAHDAAAGTAKVDRSAARDARPIDGATRDVGESRAAASTQDQRADSLPTASADKTAGALALPVAAADQAFDQSKLSDSLRVTDVREASITSPAPTTTGVTHAQPGVASSTAPVHTASLAHPVGSPQWQSELGEKITFLVRGGETQAALQVTPADLGPIDVRIDLSGGQATVAFAVQEAETRNALEAALPRLREMLAEGGIALGDTQIGQRFADDRPNEQHAGRGMQDNVGGRGEATTISMPVPRRAGVVDVFA